MKANRGTTAPADDSSDDDFVFQPITKKPKTTDSEAARKSMSGRAVAKAMGLDEDSFTRQSTSSTSSSRRHTTRPQPAPERDSSPDFDVIRPGRASRGDGDSSYTESTTIALPTQDTPVINRNREMRKQGGTSRRSSLGSRGRRASLLMENGQVAIPHKEVDAAVFYKHIQAEGRTEPQRLRQLLMWCAERALPEKPRTGVHDYNAILGGELAGSRRGESTRLTRHSTVYPGAAPQRVFGKAGILRLVQQRRQCAQEAAAAAAEPQEHGAGREDGRAGG